MNKRTAIVWTLPCLLMVALFAANLCWGAVNIPLKAVLQALTGSGDASPVWSRIVLESRLPQAITALLSGAALAVSGLMMQTLFANPLAGPSILGISDGANLGVAVAMIYFGVSSYLSTIAAALVGALIVLGIIIIFSQKVQSAVMLLIIGIMIGYLASSAISILNYYACADKIRQFVMWGMGDFGNVSLDKLPWFAGFCIAALLLSALLVKPLNALLLGEAYAANLGVNIRRSRLMIMLCTGILTAVVTAFCGPIAFIGLAVPHIARLALSSADHNILLPVTMITGGGFALLCNLLTIIPGSGEMLPLNAITPAIGAPVIIYVILNRKNIRYFN